MDIKQIQELIKFVSKSGVNEVSLEQKEFKITIKTNQPPTYIASAPAQVAPQLPAVAASVATVTTNAEPIAVTPAKEDNSSYLTIKSPMIGTFYRSANPEKPLFVNVGDEVKAGQVVCIIEAMKLFNEIESEISGRIVKILVDNASPVEYDQPLFLVEPI
ncbi:acetyl-CoA carboxylase biotin carboxyl carrier protein [Daejeonella sp.]|jgi:acetyl-CoA carboxylase biotin carboxyl carrier protein|uniref:acetyl-CoA carboxylase biotin carboxyl carrier protein n=1 Tax=Daejeonella sp. TaxID=2805397 RepID=UPI003783777F